jgi:diguanylate cyclase (GGDEF)-like protein/PAS domain S-box-containing protein
VPRMSDKDKTQGQLIKELAELRQRVAELERAETGRKRADEALKEREANFTALAENAADGIVIVNHKGNFLYVNSKAAEITGYSSDELLQVRMRDLFTPDEYKRVNIRFKKRIAGEAVSSQYETEIIRKDGTRMPLDTSIALTTWYGELVRIICLRDISGRRRFEEALRESEEKYRTLFEQANDAVFLETLEGRILDVNDKACQLLNYERQELLRLTVADIVPPEVQEILPQFVQELTKENVYFETENVRKDGSRVAVGVSTAMLEVGGQNLVLIQVRDITDRKRAEEELRESEERYRSLLENIDLGIYFVDIDHNIIMVNAAFGEKFNKPVSDLIGKKCFQEFEQRDAVCPHCPGVQAMATGRIVEVETEGVRDDQSRFDVRLRAFPILGQDGTATRFIGVAEDITDRKQLEEELRENEEKYRELSNGMLDTAWVIDFNGNFIDVNDAAVEVLGYSREELLSMGPHDIDSSLDAETITGLIAGMQTDKIQVFETTHTAKDGKVIPVEIKSSQVTYQGKRAILSIARDSTQRKQMEEELRENEERYRLLFESESDAVLVCDAETLQLEDANRAALSLYGYSKSAWRRLRVPDISAEAEKSIESIEKVKAGDPDGTKIQLRYHRKKDGTVFPVEITNAIFVSGGRKQKVIGMVRDITERVRAEETIRRLAYYDALTGLPNRVLFDDRLNRAMVHANRNQSKLAVMLLDLDYFKDINDTLGHSVGDQLLCAVANRLREILRRSDSVARLGGDEFLLLLSEMARLQDAAAIAQKILKAFRKPFLFDDHELMVTSSIGVVIYPDDGEDADTLLKNADIAMYQVKQKGRNNYQLYTSAIEPELQGDG